MTRKKSKPRGDDNIRPTVVTPPGVTMAGVQGPGFGRCDGDGVAMLRRKLRLSGEADVETLARDALGEIDKLDSLLARAAGKRPIDSRSRSQSADF